MQLFWSECDVVEAKIASFAVSASHKIQTENTQNLNIESD